MVGCTTQLMRNLQNSVQRSSKCSSTYSMIQRSRNGRVSAVFQSRICKTTTIRRLSRHPNFLSCSKRLCKLRLFITTGRDEAAPENGIDKWDVHQFVIDPPFVWLIPTTVKLTHLALYMDEYFRYAPKLDLREVHFPNL